jgi:tetratricopeptide (TPR) repeat protein
MRLALCLTVACMALGCEEQDRADARKKVETTIDHLARGRAELSSGRPEEAASEFKKSISASPEDVSLYLLLADAYRLSGNMAAASLTLKQADSISGNPDPAIRRQRAELLVNMHQLSAAIAELTVLRDADLLTDAEILSLCRLQAQRGRADDAFATLQRILQRAPDDAEAKTVEAEVLYLKGDVALATKLIDRLLAQNPSLTNARLLQARQDLNGRRFEAAFADLGHVDAADQKRSDVVSLRARVLNELNRFNETAEILEALVDEDPKDAELLALLAESKLLSGKAAEAQLLVDRVLGMEPRWARALYVRGRAWEQQDRLEDAKLDYESALLADAAFAPALSRLWRVHDRLGNKVDAIATLERLLAQNDLDSDEKVQLAKYYSETWTNIERGQKLIGQALKREPQNAEYLKIRARLDKSLAKPKRKGPAGIQIIRGGH